jgi:transposase
MARRAAVFQLYRTKRLRHLHARIDLAAEIHNHLIAVQKRYYRRFHGYIGYFRLKRHVTKLKGMVRFAHWKQLDAQAIQHIVWRIDQGYQKFFRKENRRPPTFRKRSRYRSITLSQTGWLYEGGNRLWLFGRLYRFHHSREVEGTIKTLTIKRLPTGRIVVIFSCLCEDAPINRAMTGYSAGFDFGLQTFLTGSDGSRFLGFGRFVQILHQAAEKHGTHVHHIDRFFPSTKRCHVCGFINHAITLRDRQWACPCCGTTHHRDRNAATNIYQEGASSCLQGRCKTTSVAATA